MEKFEIDFKLESSGGIQVLVIRIGNSDGTLMKDSSDPGEIYYDWPLQWADDSDQHPVQVRVIEEGQNNPDPLVFTTAMSGSGPNMKYADIFCIMEINGNEKIKRKRRSSVKVTSGGGI